MRPGEALPAQGLLSCEGPEAAGKMERRLTWPDHNHCGNVIKTKIGEKGWGLAGKSKLRILNFVLWMKRKY